VKAPKTSGGRRTPVRHTIPLGIVIFLVYSLIFDELVNRVFFLDERNNIIDFYHNID